MGGKAIKKVPVIRLEKSRYEELKNVFKEIFNDIIEMDFPIEVPGKMDFGDLDILYKSEPNLNLREIIIQKLNPVEIVTNGDVISIGYKVNETEYFQVDFIKCSNLSMGKFYFSYGDLGAIIGRITKYYGITFGFDGLYLYLFSETVEQFMNKNKKVEEKFDTTFNLGKIFLTDNPKEICDFLGLNYEKWFSGFEDKIKIFDWVITSILYNKEMFSIMNSDHRRRFNLRPFYQNFIEYINKESIETIEIKKSYGEEIQLNNQLSTIEYFRKTDELESLIEKWKKNKERHDKFNGHILIELGIEQRKLSDFIKNFKSSIEQENNKNFDLWLDTKNKNEIIELIKTRLK